MLKCIHNPQEPNSVFVCNLCLDEIQIKLKKYQNQIESQKNNAQKTNKNYSKEKRQQAAKKAWETKRTYNPL